MSATPIQQMIINAAAQYGVPPSVALGVAAHESGFNPNAQNPGSSAAGVMQLLAGTQQYLGVTNPFDPAQNINGGVSLLSKYYQQYGNWPDALQAYADGPATVGKQPPSAMAQQFIDYVGSYDASGIVGQPASIVDTLDQVAAASDSGGSPWPWIIGGAVLAVIASELV